MERTTIHRQVSCDMSSSGSMPTEHLRGIDEVHDEGVVYLGKSNTINNDVENMNSEDLLAELQI